jgi:hypothetical protein
VATQEPAVIESLLQELDVPYNANVNGTDQFGVTFYEVTQRNARRERPPARATVNQVGRRSRLPENDALVVYLASNPPRVIAHDPKPAPTTSEPDPRVSDLNTKWQSVPMTPG